MNISQVQSRPSMAAELEISPGSSMRAVIQACDNLGVPYRIIDVHSNVVEITHGDTRSFFIQASPPFNTTSAVTLSKDKDFTYQVYGSALSMPRSKAYLDPACNEQHADKVEFVSREAIVDDIEKEFSYPLIIKMNRGSLGRNVFLCRNRMQVVQAVSAIYDRQSRHYDYMVLAQEYVDIAHEYRVVWFKGDILLVYEKVTADKSQSLSPLHNDDGKAVLIEDTRLVMHIAAHLAPAQLEATFGFLGIDIVIDTAGRMSVLELNTRPGFDYFVRDNGDVKLVAMYERLLEDLVRKT